VVDAQVPFTDVTFTDSLGDGGGSFTGSCAVDHKSWSALISNDGLRRVIWPLRDGVPQGAYLLTQVRWQPPAVKQTFSAVRLDAVFKDRVIDQTLTFNTVDQNRIFRDLILYALGRYTLYSSPIVLNARQGFTVPWFTLDDTLSNVTRVRQETTGNADDGYPGSARKPVQQMLSNLSDLRDAAGTRGPEYRWLYRMNTSTGLPEMVLDLAGPTFLVGRPVDDAGRLTFDYPGGNVLTASYGFDAGSIVTYSHVIGQKQDTTQPIGTAVFDELLDQGYPAVDRVASESSVQSQSVLTAKAGGMLHATDDAWSLTLDGNKNPRRGTYGLGDWVTLRIRKGVRVDRQMRITGWSVKVADDGRSEVVSPTLEVGKWL
jgi:hypothetical protein